VPDDPLAHESLLAYASDFHLVVVPLYPHGQPVWGSGVQLASLDHAIWFHRDFRMDEWLLYTIESPSASGGRGLSVGRIFTQRGELVASVAQEGLIRKRFSQAK
jgi:acyl-CoA thioesterase-2